MVPLLIWMLWLSSRILNLKHFCGLARFLTLLSYRYGLVKMVSYMQWSVLWSLSGVRVTGSANWLRCASMSMWGTIPTVWALYRLGRSVVNSTSRQSYARAPCCSTVRNMALCPNGKFRPFYGICFKDCAIYMVVTFCTWISSQLTSFYHLPMSASWVTLG